MWNGIKSPANVSYAGIPGHDLFIWINLLGWILFAFILAKRLTPLFHAQADPRFGHPFARILQVLKYWALQWKHPRFRTAGLIHISLFAGFILLVIRAFALLLVGVGAVSLPLFGGTVGRLYDLVTQYASTIVFLCMVVAAVRRLVFKPIRYEQPPGSGWWRSFDPVFLLTLIAVLMFADALFEATATVMQATAGSHPEALAPASLTWLLAVALSASSAQTLSVLYRAGYLAHVLTFYGLLCYRPFGIQFHVETSLFNVFFAKLDREHLKPTRWQVSEQESVAMDSIGVKRFQDFTWKQMLDFYSCADCGRCSDQCPSHATGRRLSPRFFTTKSRNYLSEKYPVLGKRSNGVHVVGSLYSEDEIWSCTTCGACEEECPLLIEYIDKIVDVRRGLVDEGKVPTGLQKPLKALESRGNPFGKLEKNRAAWATKESARCSVPIVNRAPVRTLYFVDSMTSYDERMQSIARATARILTHVGEEFAILGPAERDSGHEVRRFGEETLFFWLRDQNLEQIKRSGARSLVTADPHAMNALKNDYSGIPATEHISQVLARELDKGNVRFNPLSNSDEVYAFHDPCYLGRHNHIYDEPRQVLDGIPGLKRVEMKRCRDRSFCCGGGGLMLFYEPKQDERMGVVRVRMAAEAGANVIVTACPFCLANVEDAIKVAGFEGKMTAVDLAELAERQLIHDPVSAGA